MEGARFPAERRAGFERRSQTWLALATGSWRRRRRAPRRRVDAGLAAVDWHEARWLGVALLILLLSLTDAFLTLILINQGATELNPAMKPLVDGTGRGFALWKLGLTAGGVILLTLLVRVRVFGRYLAGVALYAILAGYVLLVSYEFWLVDQLPA
jgi:hypothetical protein